MVVTHIPRIFQYIPIIPPWFLLIFPWNPIKSPFNPIKSHEITIKSSLNPTKSHQIPWNHHYIDDHKSFTSDLQPLPRGTLRAPWPSYPVLLQKSVQFCSQTLSRRRKLAGVQTRKNFQIWPAMVGEHVGFGWTWNTLWYTNIAMENHHF